MAHTSNSEPRRFWAARHHGRHGARCESCGSRATFQNGDVRFCGECLEWARQSELSKWDDVGYGD
jgi:hypothetical protein